MKRLHAALGHPHPAGPYTIRLKFPANYAIPAHSHPTDENVVVVSGALTFGMGDALAKALPPTKPSLLAASR
jgi:quercetin dioxygenase-like cupin family protein